MKKATIVFFVLSVCIINIFIFNIFSNYQVIDLLYGDTQKVTIDYQKAKKKFSNKNLINDLNKFSLENKVNITQYNFVSENSLNIYSTNPSIKSYVFLKKGEFPKNNSFISNKATNQSVGIFDIFSSTWEIKIYNFNQVKNVGLKDEMFLHDFDDQTLKLFKNTFIKYGELKFERSKLEIVKLINIPLLMLTIFSFFIYSIIFLASIIKSRQELNLYTLFGFSYFKIIKIMMGRILKSSMYSYLFIISILIISLSILEKNYILNQYFTLIVLLEMLFLIVIYLVSIFCIIWTLRIQVNFEKLKIVSMALKLILLACLFSLVSLSFERYDLLSTKFEGISYWNKTQDIYRIQVGVLNDKVSNDLITNKDYNDRINLFYNTIEKQNDAFLINSEQFNVIDYKNKKPIYNYMMNIKRPKDIYSPDGRSVIINENYLLFNPILDIDNNPIAKQINQAPNVLNIIVPHQYKKIEKEITNNYLEWFFFQSVSVPNMYNKELQVPLSKLEKKHLTINVIYSKEHQNYFTFNNFSGDSKNNVLDPIAIVYSDTLDTSNIGAFATNSLFYLDKSKGKAFENIYTALKHSNVKEINNVISIYDETNTQISSLKWELLQQILGSAILAFFSLLLFVAYVWSYYYAQIYRLTINYLFGYSYLKNNKQIIIVSINLNIIASMIAYLIFKNNSIFLLAAFFLIVEMLTLHFVGKKLMKKNVQRVLKGEM